jgi:predicted RNA-binding Zn-ribbon protein involved in translation (DUF1610 family)
MPGGSATESLAHCTNCGFEAPQGSDTWAHVDHPPLGTLTKCPECGSTSIHSER